MQPSRRPKDGRYGENPNRLYQHHQFQVVLKPSPPDILDLYLGSLEALGYDWTVVRDGPLERGSRHRDHWLPSSLRRVAMRARAVEPVAA